MKLLTLLLSLLLSSAYAADKWQSFSRPQPIYDVISFGKDGLMLATNGGVRFRTLKDDFVYHSEHGLEASEIYAITSSEKGAFAVSRGGIISAINGDALSWRVLNRSYVENKRDVVPGAVTMGGDVMVIGFQDRLAFFDAPKSTSILTINRIGDQSLSINHVNRVLAKDDSLFVELDRGMYVRKMDWDHLDSDIRLVDPNSWTLIASSRVVEGLEPWDSTKVVVDGKSLTDSNLFEEVHQESSSGVLTYARSRIRRVVPVESGYFLVGPNALFFYDGHELKDLLENKDFPLEDSFEVEAFPGGGVYAVSTTGEYSYYNGQNWSGENISALVGSGTTGFTSRLKSLSFLPDGHVLFHVWGMGYWGYSDWGTRLDYDQAAARGVCIASYDDVSSYIVTVSIVPAPDNSGFLVLSGSSSGYGLSYFTKDGSVTCANHIGSSFIAAPFHSFIDEDGRWVVYAATRGESGLSSNGGLDILRFPPPKSNGGELSRVEIKSVKGTSQTPVDMVYDPLQKRLWLVTQSNLAYYDEDLDTLLSPKSIRGISGVEYTSLDRDPHGNLWVGTSGHGAYMVSMVGKSPDTLKAVHFSSRNGMLSDQVNDVAVDSVTGKVWFSHDMGISSLERMEARDASTFMSDSAKAVKAYPIPFKPRVHSYFVIDNIDESAVVSIYNRGGSLIRSFYDDEIIGGRMEWDGNGKNGKLVAPGVYYYVVKTSSKVKKGKFIILH